MDAHIHIEERIGIPRSALELDGFRRWATSDRFPEKLRAAFVDGELFLEMSPQELEGHAKVKAALGAALWKLVEDEDLGELYPDQTLLTHPGAGLSCEPDGLFASWATFESGRLRRVEKASRDDRFVELEGTPDLVVEVVSDSSVRKDTVALREAYAAAGIAEYWVIDARGDDVSFQILHLAGDRYQTLAPDGAAQRSQVFGRSFLLERTRNRMGYFRYRLVIVTA